jgi:glutamine amidotransferase
MEKIAIINYKAGNVQSVKFALERLGFVAILTDKPEEIVQAKKVIFPGVGQAGNAMQMLVSLGLNELIPALKQPVLGICLGMQLMCNHSEEGDTMGLGIFPSNVKKFDTSLKVPHIGWNAILKTNCKLFNGIRDKSFAYFVHSYYVPLNEYTTAVSEYGTGFSAAIRKDNFYGCQFHPEKSGNIGHQILANFLML